MEKPSAWPTTDTDIVSLSALHLAVTVGPDNWHRIRPQPVALTVHLYLAPSYLDGPGESDAVADSLHYGHLAKAVERRVRGDSESGGGYKSVRALAEDVTDAAFGFVRDAVDAGKKSTDELRVVQAVRVAVELPKQILLAESFQVDLTTHVSDWVPRPGLEGHGKSTKTRSSTGAIVRVTNLILPVLIGVNPPERLAKQRVVTHLTFFEAARPSAASELLEGAESACGSDEEMDYPAVVQQIATHIEQSSHLTLEKLVYEIIRTAYRMCDAHASRIEAITVRCQKPSAISFADSPGVEMTRTRGAVVGRVSC